ncbi:hypothetical protein L0F63_000158 [Massospora cicadina]|nr:hypothetical protein L0F63_000158 [Massospora cicadina]
MKLSSTIVLSLLSSYVASIHIQLGYASYALNHLHHLCTYRCNRVFQMDSFDLANCRRKCNHNRERKIAACNQGEENQYGTPTATLNTAQSKSLQRCQNECVSPHKDEIVCKYECDLGIERIQQQCKKGTIPEDMKSFC